jgi:hypothetical protein
MPLRVSPDGSGAAILDELVKQIGAIRGVAADAEVTVGSSA